MFHGYQHEMGQGGAPIFNEVEAYLFGYSVAYQYNNGIGGLGQAATGIENSVIGFIYGKSFTNLFYSNQFSTKDFRNAVLYFRDGSVANIKDVYNKDKYPEQRRNQKRSLIKEFYPLERYRNP